MTQNCI